jgi:hypothetical protein
MNSAIAHTLNGAWTEFLIWTGFVTTTIFDYSNFNTVLLDSGINITNFDLLLKLSEMLVQWISSIYACVKIVQWASGLIKKKNKDGK